MEATNDDAGLTLEFENLHLGEEPKIESNFKGFKLFLVSNLLFWWL